MTRRTKRSRLILESQIHGDQIDRWQALAVEVCGTLEFVGCTGLATFSFPSKAHRDIAVTAIRSTFPNFKLSSGRYPFKAL